MLLNPKTGATIGYQETKGTTAEPFNVPMAWQASSLSYVNLQANQEGGLQVSAPSDEALRMDTQSTITYVGTALPGSATSSAVWKIKLLTYSAGNLVSITWANGSSTYSNIWDNHTSYMFS